ncbi:MAG: response regulator [Deltaproteobacteria bacterium]|jgi:putative two-component system response regulator|nr:response regulator [Deltaproteobacteria bacterium]
MNLELRSAKKEIFVVDDEFADLGIEEDACGQGFSVVGFESAATMFSAISRGRRPEMIFLDTDMPGTDGFEALEQLKAGSVTKNIPVVMVTAKHDQASALAALRAGAVDYLPKPFLGLMLPGRVDLHLTIKEQRETIVAQERKIKEQARKLAECRDFLDEAVSLRTGQMASLQSAILQAVSDLVTWPNGVDRESRRDHAKLRVFLEALYERGIALEEGGASVDRDIILQSARLHDVGKLAIEGSILNKPGRLTAEEFETVKLHPLLGVDMLEGVQGSKDVYQFLRYAKVFAGTHHERWDGTGYPHGLKGTDIPMAGRVMAIADVYDGLTRISPWKKPFTHDMAVRTIVGSKGTHFDPVLVEVFADVADSFGSYAIC